MASLHRPCHLSRPEGLFHPLRKAGQSTVFAIIRKLPGIELSEAVDEAWKKAKHDQRQGHQYVRHRGGVWPRGRSWELAANILRSATHPDYRSEAREVLTKFYAGHRRRSGVARVGIATRTGTSSSSTPRQRSSSSNHRYESYYPFSQNGHPPWARIAGRVAASAGASKPPRLFRLDSWRSRRAGDFRDDFAVYTEARNAASMRARAVRGAGGFSGRNNGVLAHETDLPFDPPGIERSICRVCDPMLPALVEVFVFSANGMTLGDTALVVPEVILTSLTLDRAGGDPRRDHAQLGKIRHRRSGADRRSSSRRNSL